MNELSNNLSTLTIRNSLETLISNNDINNYQKNIFRKINHSTFYLVDYNDSNNNNEIEYSIKILGDINKNGKREEYNIKLSNGHFVCNCKDFIFRSKKCDIVCKHITFLVCKVGHIYDVNYFTTKKLSNKHCMQFINIITSKSLWNTDISIKNINQQFKQNKKELTSDDVCPICYDELLDTEIISCPTCNNYIHTQCIKIWLQLHDTCVFCRSSIFKNYR